ncbi:cytochrome P450 2F3-like isoform X4 [Hippopotamus amphibius kiboko]|uniref:cytochrome P450 2F3-like isoform X4 n=1 Tax=Hippopotamus amphibius kiboko TaxID=575201 RepID=UPI00259A5B30|nr:cytochrome P450 2F3-like isoform X4 [Hippopotamus amphibius kiboko]
MCDTPFNPTFLICRSISNIIYSVIFGHRVDYQDEDCEMFLGLLAENLKLVDTFWVQDEDKQHVPHGAEHAPESLWPGLSSFST